MDVREDPPPFLRLPLELRLIIYNQLLVAETFIFPSVQNLMCTPDYHIYEASAKEVSSLQDKVLSFRNVGPPTFSAQTHEGKRRATYKIRSGRFRARCIDVTYSCINTPDIYTNILGVNRQIHNEAATVLYSSYTFDFDSNIEACVPFLMDLTPFSRSCISQIGVVKRALPYDKDFDRCEWRNMCRYIANHLSLTALSLGVVSGKPVIGGNNIEPFPEIAFDSIIRKHKRDEMSWARDLMKIRGLQNLAIRACIEHCPPPGSDAMTFFVEFSASVESGFSDYLTAQMISQEL